MNLEANNEGRRWVIKDQDDNFAHRNSIGKSGKNTCIYISFKTFSPECKGYISKESAELALQELNRRKSIMGLPNTFNLEYNIISELTKLHREFQGENMVIYEKTHSNILNRLIPEAI